MVSFIDAHRTGYGAEAIWAQLPIAPSVHYEHEAREAQPDRLPPWARRDAELSVEIERVYRESFHVYGARKVWLQPGREGIAVARCTVERMMRALGLQGVRGGKRCRTTIPHTAAPGGASTRSSTQRWNWSTDSIILGWRIPIGGIPPAGLETAYHRQQDDSAMAA